VEFEFLFTQPYPQNDPNELDRPNDQGGPDDQDGSGEPNDLEVSVGRRPRCVRQA